MVMRAFGTAVVEIDAEGFLVERDAWTPEIAEAIARELGFVLGPRQWAIVNLAREELASHGRLLRPRQLAARAGIPEGTLRALFPGPTSEIIARIAGIPRHDVPATTRTA